jgi:hypothetical protein
MALRFLLALVLLSFGGSAVDAQSVFRWKLQTGEKLHYTRTHDQTTTRIAEGMKSQESVLATIHMTLAVNEVASDRTAQITLLIDRIQYRRKSPTGELQYDSSTDAVPRSTETRLAATLKELLGSHITFKMTARGEIGDIRISRKATAKAGAPSPRTAPPLTAKGIKNLLPFLLLPEDPIDTGTTWQEQTEYLEPALGLRKIDLTYRYIRPELNVGRQVEKIAFTGDVRFVAPSGSKVTTDVRRNNYAGTVYFDKNAGRLAAREAHEKLSMLLLEEGRRIEQEVEASVTVKLTR